MKKHITKYLNRMNISMKKIIVDEKYDEKVKQNKCLA